MADSIARREKVQVNCQTNWILSTVQFKTNDNQFELRTTPKKGNRGSCCYFLDHFPDHFQSSCFFFYLFSACVFARLRFSPNWFVGLSTDRINISVSDGIVCWVFCHRVSWPVDRHTHHDHLVFVFCQKDVGNRHQKQNQLEHLTLDFEYEVSQRDNFVTLAFIVICDYTCLETERRRESWTFYAVRVGWFSNNNSKWKQKKRKWAQRCDGL